MSTPKEIGERIRAARVKNKLTQEDVAIKLKVTPSAYTKIERGETDPSATRLFELANIFKVDIVTLLKDEEDKTKCAV